MDKQEKIEKIKKFLEGKDNQEYIVGIEGHHTSNEVILLFDHPTKGKYMEKHKFTPFIFIKDFKKLGKHLYNSKEALNNAIKNFGITIKKLRTDNHPRLENGYQYMVSSSKRVGDLIMFFSKANPDYNIYKDKYQLFLSNTNLEQFLIASGKRLFKGFKSYNDVHKFYFDIETTSLKPEDGNIFLIGMKDNRGFEKVLSIDENNPIESERQMIIDFFKIIVELQPSIVAGYNSEAFDFYYILGRANILKLDLGTRDEDGNLSYDVRTSLDPENPLKRQKSTVKFGGDTESYEKTVMWGMNVIDISHSVRQAMAINSDIKGWGLKYICQYKEFAKPNRMYVAGDKIYEIWKENKNYFINTINNSYKLIPDAFQDKPDDYKIKLINWINGCKNNPDCNDSIKKVSEFFDHDENNVEVISGKDIIGQYLIDDLYETEMVDNDFGQANYMMGGILPEPYARSYTMGNAGKWKMLMITYSYENGLAIPIIDRKRDIVGGLSRTYRVGFSLKLLKMDYKSLYPAIQLTHSVFPSLDITNVLESMLIYFRDGRIEYQELASKHKELYEATGNPLDRELASLYDTKQLPIKILANSQFGALSSPLIFNWGDNNVGEEITCTGRQYLRAMVKHFISYGFNPAILDTDGCNFTIPINVDEIKYITKDGNELIGYKAVLGEFNEKYMTGVMKLEEDGVYNSNVIISRKNYATVSPKGKIKTVGNSLKSARLPKYVENSFKNAINLLLKGDSKQFVEDYYTTLTKIYNKEIPLVEIANKAKVKQKVSDYQHDIIHKKNKNGADKSRQAHMELLVAAGLNPDLGKNIYYINNGTVKSHGDIGHSYLIDEMEFISNPNKTGEYNVPRAISVFNKRMNIFLVCFGEEVRKNLLVTNPEKRGYFTDQQLELVSGSPMKTEDQDVLYSHEYNPTQHKNIPLFEMEDREVSFWNRIGKDPREIFADFTTDHSSIKLLTKEELELRKKEQETIIQFFKLQDIPVKTDLEYVLNNDAVIRYDDQLIQINEDLVENVTKLSAPSWILSKFEYGVFSDIQVIDKEIYEEVETV